jgi:hypothetical protein
MASLEDRWCSPARRQRSGPVLLVAGVRSGGVTVTGRQVPSCVARMWHGWLADDLFRVIPEGLLRDLHHVHLASSRCLWCCPRVAVITHGRHHLVSVPPDPTVLQAVTSRPKPSRSTCEDACTLNRRPRPIPRMSRTREMPVQDSVGTSPCPPGAGPRVDHGSGGRLCDPANCAACLLRLDRWFLRLPRSLRVYFGSWPFAAVHPNDTDADHLGSGCYAASSLSDCLGGRPEMHPPTPMGLLGVRK